MDRFFTVAVNAIFLTIFLTNLSAIPAHADQLALPAADVIAPAVEQNDFVSKIKPGTEHQIRVTATDNVAIKSVILYYRNVGDSTYRTRVMQNIIDTDEYTATLSADDLNAEGIEYYIQATDTAGNTLLLGYAFSPLTILVDHQVADNQLANANEAAAVEPIPKVKKEKSYKWLWIGLGVLAAGAIAANASGGDDGGGGGGGAQEPTVIVNAPVPQ